MYVRERILAIRLMEKLQTCPAYARALGIEAGTAQVSEVTDEDQMQNRAGL